MAATQETRRSRRIQVQGEVDATGTPTFQASVINLSRDGVCVEHAAKLEPGQVCDLRLRIPPMSFSVRARIVWSNPHRQGGGAGRFRSGAEFVEVSEDARAVIDVIVTRPPA
ncbi:MAG TPA: PilZ domain-containing protein [Candidatus Methylomirabilis sp.]|jgi:hypothetical protein